MKPDFEVGIIGAGFGGLIAALRLKHSGRQSFVIFERANEVGGTWRDNIYPGCGCDVHSHLYSIASEPNPNWSQLFSAQPEILAYLKNVVANNQLNPFIRYNTDVVDIRFLEDSNTWQLTDQHGKTTVVKMLILATGPLNRPNMPVFKGLENYKGKQFHSSAWDNSYDLTNKRVAIIGTGASAIQIIPNIAPIVGQLNVFQRTPAWVMPRRNRTIGSFQKALFNRIPIVQKTIREIIYWIRELFGLGFVGNHFINKLMEKSVLKQLEKEVQNPNTRAKLIPNYQIGCKRILVADDFYPTFNRPNVDLITDSIDHITENGICTKNGTHYPADVIIFATGFIAAEVELHSKITGINGRLLIDEWRKNGAEAYLGATVSGYPNMAFILGPNTGLGHSSVVHMMESQMNYLMQYLEQLEKGGSNARLDLKPQVQTAYNKHLQQQFDGTVWNSGCKSWYLNNKGKNTTLYPRLTAAFRKATKTFNPNDYFVSG